VNLDHPCFLIFFPIDGASRQYYAAACLSASGGIASDYDYRIRAWPRIGNKHSNRPALASMTGKRKKSADIFGMRQ
jgi:hypothetical protein